MTLEHLISPAYLDEQRTLHASPRGYGQRGHKWTAKVNEIGWLQGCRSVLDYGCGAGSLCEQLRLKSRFTTITEYDPAIPDKDTPPSPADLVVCTDVLEHIEEDKIDAVLSHLTSRARLVLFVVISLVETAKVLSDGRQAHILLRPPAWWRVQFEARDFTVIEEPQVKPEKQWVAVLRRNGAC